MLRPTALLATTALTGVALAGCWSSVSPDGIGASHREAGTGYLADGADPFHPIDASDGSYLDPESGVWITPDVVTGNNDERYGYISLGSNGTVDTFASYAGATFRFHYVPEDPSCTMIAYGAWNMDDCPTSAVQRDTEPRPLPNAGRIEIRGGTQPISLTPNRSTGEYSDFYQSDETFPPGASIELRAAGGVVPAFTRTFRIPASLVASVEVAGTVRRDQPLDVTWQPLDAQLVYVSLYQTYDSGGGEHTVQMSALFEADELREAIPPVLLRHFQAGRQLYVFMRSYNLEEFHVAEWPITIYVAGRGTQDLFDVE
jgi:hypothetical protein